MKHQVCALLLFVSFSVCAENAIADKAKRIGRFSHEDSFNENLVETVLKNSSAVVKKNVNNLLYPLDEEDAKQRLLLLGGTSNASTTAIAKAIALRCGYEYYVVEASALLREYREGRQMLLSEIRPIIKEGKPIAIIITELPEMADYSGLLASTLWLLIDQCAQYQDVLVIATSALNKGQLPQEVKERFGGDIITVSLDRFEQKNIEDTTVQKMSWIEKHKVAIAIAGGLTCFAVAAGHLYAQILFAATYVERENEKKLLEGKTIAAFEAMLLLQKKEYDLQDQAYGMQAQQYSLQNQQHDKQKEQCTKQEAQYDKQKEQYDKQKEQYTKQEAQYAMQREQYRTQLQQGITQISLHNSVRALYYAFVDGVLGAKEEVKKQRSQWDKVSDQEKQGIQKKLKELK